MTASLRTAALLLAVAATACSYEGPIVAPLRYDPAPPALEEPFRARPPEASPVAPTASLPWRLTTLPNGLSIAHLERRALPIVSVRLVVTRGAADAWAPFDTYDLLGHVLFSATQARTAAQLSEAYGNLGARRDAFLGPDACGLMAEVGAGAMDAAIALIAEAVMRPRFSAFDFSNTRTRWLADLRNSGGNPDLGLQRNARMLLFGNGHPYGFAIPLPAHTHGLRVEDVAALHASLFQPAQATLIVVGDATKEAVDASASRWLGAWSSAAPPLPRAPWPVPLVAGPRVVLIEHRNRAQIRAGVYVRGPTAREDRFAAEVLARTFGGLTSPLRAEVRDHTGAAYDLGAAFVRQRSASLAGIGGAFDAPKAMQALRAILNAIRAARAGGVREDELEQARTGLLAEFRTRVSTNEGLARMASAALANDELLDTVAAYPASLQAVTTADLRRVAERYFGEDALRLVVIGSRDLEGELFQLGLGAVERRDGYGLPAR